MPRQFKQCSLAAARLGAIINDARVTTGRARLDLVNNRVNSAITYKSDIAQWGVADLWSPPLAANGTGSFSTSFGDCEDFASPICSAARGWRSGAGAARVAGA